MTWPHWTEVDPQRGDTATQWHAAIVAACQGVARGSKWNPQIYGESLDWSERSPGEPKPPPSTTASANFPSHWNEDLRNELVNDVYLCLLSRKFVSEGFDDIFNKLNKEHEENPSSNTQDKFKSFVQRVVTNVLRQRANQSDEQRLKERFRDALSQTLEPITESSESPNYSSDQIAYGIPGVSRLVNLDAADLGKARIVLDSFPPETPSIDDLDRQRAPRYFTEQTMSTIVTEIARELKKAITPQFLDSVIEHVFERLALITPTSLEKNQILLANAAPGLRDELGDNLLPSHQLANKQIVREFVDTLQKRDQAILAAIYERWGHMTDQQIAEALIPPVTRQRVDQIRKDIASRFRHFLQSRHNYLFDSSESLDEVISSISFQLHQLLLEIDISGALRIGETS